MFPDLLPRRHPGWPSFAVLGPIFAPADGLGRPGLQGRRILIVEDEYFIAIELDRWLEEAGHEVIGIAGTVRQAVASARDHRPDLVIMDIRLAGERDGVDAANDIFAETGIRSLFASAHSDSPTRSRAAGAAPLGWLAKPYTKAKFLAALEAAIATLDADGG